MAKSALEQPLVASAAVEAEVDADVEGGGKGGAGAAAVFNRGTRNAQDVLFTVLFIAGMTFLVARLIFVVSGPIMAKAHLREEDMNANPYGHMSSSSPDTLTVTPLLAMLFGIFLALPGCFLLLWGTKGCKGPFVRICLVICLVVFALTAVITGTSVVLSSTPGLADFIEEDGHFDSAMRNAADPPLGIAPGPEYPGIAGALESDPMFWLQAPTEGPSSIAESPGLDPLHSFLFGRRSRRFWRRFKRHARRQRIVGRRLWSVWWLRLRKAQGSLIAAVNVLWLFLLLSKGSHFFDLTAVIVSDAAKFVITSGRGLVFAVIALTSAAVLAALPAVFAAVNLTHTCQNPFSPGELSEWDGCEAWEEAVIGNFLFGDFLQGLTVFLILWLGCFIEFSLKFVAAHVVGQCYGNMSTSVDEDEGQLVLRAVKCAMKESFGTISCLSLASASMRSASFLLNNLFIKTFRGSVFSAIPSVACYFAFSMIGLFLSYFVLPLSALRGQSVVSSIFSSVPLLKRNLLASATVTLAAQCIINLLLFYILFDVAAIGGTAAAALTYIQQQLLGWMDLWSFWFVVISILVVGTTAAAELLFHAMFATTIATTFLCLALEGKAKESTTSTPLAIKES